MDSQTKKQLFAIAKKHLTDHPHDPAHGLEHSLAVVKNAEEIAKTIDQKIDLEALIVAAFWHDVIIPGDGSGSSASAEHVQKEMERHGVPNDQQEVIFLAVKYHEYDQEPKNIEGEVLFDADKLDILNINRWQKMFDAEKAGLVSHEKAQSAFDTVIHWTSELRDKLHFDYSRELFDQYLAKLKQEPLCQEICNRYGVELS